MKSFILYGPPEIGKMSYLRRLPEFKASSLLDFSQAELVIRYKESPSLLASFVENEFKYPVQEKTIFINHLDRVPHLVPSLHLLIKEKNLRLAMTSTHFLEDLDYELIEDRYLNTQKFLDSGETIFEAMTYGLLYKAKDGKEKYLNQYVENFIDDGILAYNKVRNLVAFHLFMDLVPKLNGTKINFTELSEKLSVDYKTVQNYFNLLIESHVGFYLNATDLEIRKVQNNSPTFYVFDTGFLNALNKFKDLDVLPRFKTFCLNEAKKNVKYELSNFMTKDGVGVDLILTDIQSGKFIFVQFINERIVTKRSLKALSAIQRTHPEFEYMAVNLQSEKKQELFGVPVLSVLEFLKRIKS